MWPYEASPGWLFLGFGRDGTSSSAKDQQKLPGKRIQHKGASNFTAKFQIEYSVGPTTVVLGTPSDYRKLSGIGAGLFVL